ncbi:YbhN family protein [Accumulibacter sp.]|uniref:lysylphosphatidylglycerol synthase transmembrane domain-containing protein n=1 Tax=Accumulibacter sp. TaxID=2053492 RepID=UPI0035B092E3
MTSMPPADRQERVRLRGVALFAGKLAVAAGAIAWLHSRGLLDFGVLADVPRSSATFLLLLGGCASMAVALGLLAWRMQLLLRFSRFDVGVRPAVLITFVAYFFGTLLPGMVGADAIRAAYFCSRVAERRMDVVTTILFDRVIGLYSLLLLGSLALVGAWLGGIWREGFAFLMVAPLALALATGGALLFACLPGSAIGDGLRRRLPWHLKTLVGGTRSLLRSPPLLAAAIGISLLSHLFMVCSFVVIAVLIADSLPVFLHFAISPLAVVLNSVPISPGGLGLTEGAFAYLFQVAGSSNGALIGLLGRIVQYAAFVVGGLISVLLLLWRDEAIESLHDAAPAFGRSVAGAPRDGIPDQ